MKLAHTAGLTAILLVLGTETASAAPSDWHETPTGLKAFVPYAIDGSAGVLWTVGAVNDREGFQPVAARWDGSAWKETPQPFSLGRLLDVDASWAVGSQQTPGDPSYQSRLLAQRWNGQSWNVVPAPAFGDKTSREFTSVATLGEQVWATGWGGTGFVYRYDGKRWTGVNDKVIGSAAYLWDIEPLAANNVWVAADDGIKHYNGRGWTQVKLPGDTTLVHLLGVEANSPSDIWAVGHREDPELRRRPVAYHFDGTSWTEIATPMEAAELNSLALVNGQPVAVGETRAGGPYILRMTPVGFERQADPPGAGMLFSSASREGKLWIGGFGDGTGSSDSYIGFARQPIHPG